MRLIAFPQWDKLMSLHGCALSCRLMRQDGHVFVTSFLDNSKQPFRIVLISIGQSGAQYDCCIFHCQNCRADSSNAPHEGRRYPRRVRRSKRYEVSHPPALKKERRFALVNIG